ncbi:MAG TPA: two-component system response regulator, partial [Ruminococcaceae bacterium]|nr:two-component system response regulator [Oscillospiraceae bacterium]
ASNGKLAVDSYKAEKPDLVIMDITMPVMDGLQALKEIKKDDAGASIIMCSAMGQEAMVVDALKHGAKDFIVKPFKADRIMKTVKSILG